MFLLVLSVLCCTFGSTAGATDHIVSYMTSGSDNTPASLRYSNISHLIYSFLEPTMDGGIKDFNTKEKAKLLEIVSYAKKYNTKIMVSFNQPGHFSHLFPHVSSDPTARANFANNVYNYIKENGLNGVDIDWEYPSNGTAAGYVALLKALHDKLHPEGYLVSSAVSAFKKLIYEIPNAAFPYIDWFNIMCYDFAGGGSAMGPTAPYKEVTEAMETWLRKGLPAEKAMFGVPFYGVTWNAGGPSGRAIAYKDIWEKYHPAPAINKEKLCYFGGRDMMKKKAQFAVDKKLPGLMIWQYDQDTDDYEGSLLTAINKVITPAH